MKCWRWAEGKGSLAKTNISSPYASAFPWSATILLMLLVPPRCVAASLLLFFDWLLRSVLCVAHVNQTYCVFYVWLQQMRFLRHALL